MKPEVIIDAMNYIDDRFKVEAMSKTKDLSVSSYDEKENFAMRKKTERVSKTALVAAVLAAALITSAFAAWGIHSARQQELKAELKIEENEVSSYVEYDIPGENENGIVLLSSVNNGEFQRIFMNVFPVYEEEAAVYNEKYDFFWNLEGTDGWGLAAPYFPADVTACGNDEIQAAVQKYAYDKDTKTMTLRCIIPTYWLKDAMERLGTDTCPLTVEMQVGEDTLRAFGPVSIAITDEQQRLFDFGNVCYHDSASGKDIELVGLKLTPFGAVWVVDYDGAEQFHTPETDWSVYRDWANLEDKICQEAKIIFSDGTEFSTGGALRCAYENGVVCQTCSWATAIDINDVERIVFDDVVLWEK